MILNYTMDPETPTFNVSHDNLEVNTCWSRQATPQVQDTRRIAVLPQAAPAQGMCGAKCIRR